MKRIRSVKPELFEHEALYDTEKACGLPVRLAFISLWINCDREGRFEWRPKRLQRQLLVYDDDVDVGVILEVLRDADFIHQYEVAGKLYGVIPTWHKHQKVNHREAKSALPGPEMGEKVMIETALSEQKEVEKEENEITHHIINDGSVTESREPPQLPVNHGHAQARNTKTLTC